jgi:hypothetical protein
MGCEELFRAFQVHPGGREMAYTWMSVMDLRTSPGARPSNSCARVFAATASTMSFRPSRLLLHLTIRPTRLLLRLAAARTHLVPHAPCPPLRAPLAPSPSAPPAALSHAPPSASRPWPWCWCCSLRPSRAPQPRPSQAQCWWRWLVVVLTRVAGTRCWWCLCAAACCRLRPRRLESTGPGPPCC